MTSRDPERSNSIPIHLEPNISKTAGDRDSDPVSYQQEMAYGESNGHVAADVTWQYLENSWRCYLATTTNY